MGWTKIMNICSYSKKKKRWKNPETEDGNGLMDWPTINCSVINFYFSGRKIKDAADIRKIKDSLKEKNSKKSFEK